MKRHGTCRIAVAAGNLRQTVSDAAHRLDFTAVDERLKFLLRLGPAHQQESAVDGKAFRLELLPDESFAPMAEVMD